MAHADAVLEEHIHIARMLGIGGLEIGEELLHLTPYVGFPAVVSAFRIAEGALTEGSGGRA